MPFRTWGAVSPRRLPSLLLALSLLVTSLASPAASFAQAQGAADGQDAAQARTPRPIASFVQTGYRIDRDSFWDYFSHRGGVATFGYPVSRDFLFQGCTSQFFQRLDHAAVRHATASAR